MSARIYIAGPMTGKPRYNLAEFEAARERSKQHGYDVVIPHDCSSRVWQRYYARDFDFDVDICEYGDPLIGEMFAEDILEVTRADMVGVLDEWWMSRGARIEVLTALLLGKRVFVAMTGVPLLPTQLLLNVRLGLSAQIKAVRETLTAQLRP